MGEIINAIVLGIIQGLTEFLPVSSSGHLELGKWILGDESMAEESLLMTVTLHVATALSTIVIFRKDIADIFKGLFQFKDNDAFQFSLRIVVSMIPAAVVGLFFEDAIDNLFNKQIVLVGLMLLVTGVLLYFADKAKDTGREVTIRDAFIIGIAQAIAILPGISRSGATISTTVLLGIDKGKAARFSFLMVVPLILGKMAKDLLDGDVFSETVNVSALGVGFVAAFFTGLLACSLMIQLVKNSKLMYFSIYCIIVGILAITIYTLF
jgi:undecaprenyl-diphosphatase